MLRLRVIRIDSRDEKYIFARALHSSTINTLGATGEDEVRGVKVFPHFLYRSKRPGPVQ